MSFLTRQGCPLCDDALAVLRRYARGEVEIIDIDLDLDLLERWDEQVPVVLDGSGRVLSQGPLSDRRARWIAWLAWWRWRGPA